MSINFETIIGLEVHAQLATATKMFCSSNADYASAPPNTHVCPVCLGMPGVLPVINRQAVEFVVMTSLALNCQISHYTRFDRKNYPYPDLMKGYQISQSYSPIGYDGWFNISTGDGIKKRVSILNVHLEEDVAKLIHQTSLEGESYSLIDVNRSGVPLMEVVGGPDLHSPEEARQYLITLRSILQYLGVSTANMEEGSFRCDANISVRAADGGFATAKVEVKNMNSFRSVFRALEYEDIRLRALAAEGNRGTQETRGWVEAEGKTVSQRSKEYAHDYRYFPEPDLPPLVLTPDYLGEVKARLPELPEARRDRFVSELDLSTYDAGLLTVSKPMADYFEHGLIVKALQDIPMKERAKLLANWLLGELSRLMNATGTEITAAKVSPDRLGELIRLTRAGAISGTSAKTVFEEMFNSGGDPAVIVQERGLGQISGTREIEEIVGQVVAANAQAVADYKAGKSQSLTFMVGQVMRATKGRANARVTTDLLKKKLEEV